jgi:hypothetical protein
MVGSCNNELLQYTRANELPTRKEIQLPSTYDVQSVHGGPEQVWFITTNNEIFASGNNHHQILGIQSSEADVWMKQVSWTVEDAARISDPVVSITAGYAAAFWITKNGACFVTGQNSCGCAGLGQDVESIKEPTQLHLPDNLSIKKVAHGSRHSLILARDGSVWATGSGECGQVAEQTNVYTPKLVVFLDRVVDIAAGYNHCIVVTENGEAFGFGSHNLGQTG